MRSPLVQSESGEGTNESPKLHTWTMPLSMDDPASTAHQRLLEEEEILLVDQDRTDFTRLLEQREGHNSIMLGGEEDRFVQLLSARNRQRHIPFEDGDSPLGDVYRSPAWTVAGTVACVLHLGFLWGSYMSTSWSESVLYAKVPLLGSRYNATEITIPLRPAHFASILQDWCSAEQFSLMMAVWISSLLLPCTFMVLAPSRILQDTIKPVTYLATRYARTWDGRNILEISVRWALLVVYSSVILLPVVVASMEWKWGTGGDFLTSASLQLRPQGGGACYVAGIAAALATFVLVRLPIGIPKQESRWQDVTEYESPLLLQDQKPLPFDDIDSAPPMTVLEDDMLGQSDPRQPEPVVETRAVPATSTNDETEADNNGARDPLQGRHRDPLLESPLATDDSHESTPLFSQSVPSRFQEGFLCKLCACCRLSTEFQRLFVIFQLAIVCMVLYLPSFTLPLMRWSYRGPVADATSYTPALTHQMLVLWELPIRLFRQMTASGTAVMVQLIIGVVLILTIYLIPLVALVMSVGTWVVSTPRSASWCRAWLYSMQPAIGTIVLAVALLWTVPGIEPWSRVVFRPKSPLCESLGLSWVGVAIDDTMAGTLPRGCLEIVATFKPGAWLFLALSIALELLVTLTLRWRT